MQAPAALRQHELAGAPYGGALRGPGSAHAHAGAHAHTDHQQQLPLLPSTRCRRLAEVKSVLGGDKMLDQAFLFSPFLNIYLFI